MFELALQLTSALSVIYAYKSYNISVKINKWWTGTGIQLFIYSMNCFKNG